MKTKKLIILTTTIVLFFLSAYAQPEKNTLKKLMAKTWQMDREPFGGTIYFNEYKTDTIFMIIMFSGEKHIIKSLFYLSNQIDTVFNEKKLRKRKEGKYIVISALNAKNEETGVFSVSEIVEINETELKLKGIQNNYTMRWKAATIPEKYNMPKEKMH